MLGFLVLHIMALLFWAASLLYLPTLITGRHQGQVKLSDPGHCTDSLARFLFTRIATPAALAAIMAGTVVFALERITAFWLILKLALVALLVVCHALTGTLILLTESQRVKHPRRWGGLLIAIELLLMTGILWAVLAKPIWEWPQ